MTSASERCPSSHLELDLRRHPPHVHVLGDVIGVHDLGVLEAGEDGTGRLQARVVVADVGDHRTTHLEKCMFSVSSWSLQY